MYYSYNYFKLSIYRSKNRLLCSNTQINVIIIVIKVIKFFETYTFLLKYKIFIFYACRYVYEIFISIKYNM